MRALKLVIIALLALVAPAAIAQPIGGGSGVVIQQKFSDPFTGTQAGVWNHGGILTWRSSGGVSTPQLQCGSCTSNNVLPFYNSSALYPSNFFYDAVDKQFCDGAAGGSYCIRLDANSGIASFGYHLYFGDGNFIQNDTVGTKIYHNGANFAQTIGSGSSEEWRVNGKIHSLTGGFVFPDSSVQTTAAVAGAVNPATRIFNPKAITESVCAGSLITQCSVDGDWGCDGVCGSTGGGNAPVKRILAFGVPVDSHVQNFDFYWPNATSTVTVKCELFGGWQNHPSPLLQTGSVSVSTQGSYTCALPLNQALAGGTYYLIALYETSGTYDINPAVHGVTASVTNPTCGALPGPQPTGNNYYTYSWTLSVSDVTPGTISPITTTGSGTCRISPISPVVTVP